MTDKVVLITGAAKGIGAACAERFAQAGYRVAVHFRSNPEEAAAWCKQLENRYPAAKAQAFQCDLTDEAACQGLIKDVKEQLGRLDVLVNNAGVAIDQILPFAKPDDFDLLLKTNLRPVFLLSKFSAKIMMKQKSGNIINISSVVGFTGNPGQSMYATTKSGIVGFTKSIAAELAPYGIRCNCVAPGFIKTAMTDGLADNVKEAILAKVPMRRLGESAEVAKAVHFLASEEASYITGSTIHVNGGMYTN